MTKTARSEDARDFYQARLALMYAVGFGISAVFLVGVIGVRGVVGEGIARELSSPSRWFHLVATALSGALWQVLSRRALSSATLDVLDAVGLISLSALLNLNAGLFEIRTVAVFNLVLTTGLPAVLRAVAVPSTPLRTLVLGLVASATSIIVFFTSALHPAWPVKQIAPPDWPLSYQFISLALWLVALVATAVVASRVIYNLRREVRAARRLGQYVLDEKLGEGGMGVVYRATHALLRRETALKLLPPDRIDERAIRRFEREVVATARLRHPNTIAIYDYGRTPDGVFYYAMEYLDGLTLADLVGRSGPLSPSRTIWILEQVCASLDEAHSMGLVHRDIKPANVMIIGHIAAYDLVKVLDFGLVRSLEPIVGSTVRTSDDELTGTPLYMSPEAIRHPESVEPRSDLYAVAALGYFMLSGRHVFEGPSLVEICAAHLNLKPPSISERLGRAVPADLESLILRGLSKSVTDRPPTAAAFREALLACKVPPWTQEEARAWWRSEGERLARGPRRPVDLAHAPTISIARPVDSSDFDRA